MGQVLENNKKIIDHLLTKRLLQLLGPVPGMVVFNDENQQGDECGS